MRERGIGDVRGSGLSLCMCADTDAHWHDYADRDHHADVHADARLHPDPRVHGYPDPNPNAIRSYPCPYRHADAYGIRETTWANAFSCFCWCSLLRRCRFRCDRPPGGGSGPARMTRVCVIVLMLLCAPATWALTPTPTATTTPAAGSCCDIQGNPLGPGCDNASCQNCICSCDAFCCDGQWDTQCAEEAAGI